MFAAVAQRGATGSIDTSAAATDDRPELAMLEPTTAVGDISRDGPIVNVARSAPPSATDTIRLESFQLSYTSNNII